MSNMTYSSEPFVFLGRYLLTGIRSVNAVTPSCDVAVMLPPFFYASPLAIASPRP